MPDEAEFSHRWQDTVVKAARRTHVSIKPEPVVLRQKFQTKEWRFFPKPAGFWYEVNGDWRRWCRDNDWDVNKLGYLHAVELGQTKMLIVDTLEKLDAFHRRYSVPDGPRRSTIDWQKVSRTYDGIEIAPYQWERRLDGDVDWYYTWDCACGVVWRPKGATVTLLRKLPARKPKEAVYA